MYSYECKGDTGKKKAERGGQMQAIALSADAIIIFLVAPALLL